MRGIGVGGGGPGRYSGGVDSAGGGGSLGSTEALLFSSLGAASIKM